jgi:hypothetical protein
MILFHGVVVDLVSFNESYFGIFNESERPTLIKMFKDCDSVAPKFLSLLSIEQKQRVVEWACQRSTFSVEELKIALTKFTKFLKTVSYSTYPEKKPKIVKKTK